MQAGRCNVQSLPSHLTCLARYRWRFDLQNVELLVDINNLPCTAPWLQTCLALCRCGMTS